MANGRIGEGVWQNLAEHGYIYIIWESAPVSDLFTPPLPPRLHIPKLLQAVTQRNYHFVRLSYTHLLRNVHVGDGRWQQLAAHS
jgi:hypothetical protein